MTLKKVLFATLVAVSAVALTASDSFAFGHRHGSYGCWGGGSWGGSWGSRGCWGGYGSGGCWGGGSWGSRGCWGGGSWGSRGCWGGYTTVTYVAPACDCCGSTTCDGCSASTNVVYDGYASRRPVTTAVVASSAPAVKTRLTLRVPAEAKVTLAGIETKQTGEVRKFATSRLAAGQTWDEYKVVVEMTRDGKTLRQERTVTLTGGQNQELAVNFDSDSTQQVAKLTR